MPQMDEIRDTIEAQPALDLSLPEVRRGGRIWLLAAEPRDEVRGSPPDPSPFKGRGLHVFFNPLSGSPAFAPSDLLLFREPDGSGFRLLVADLAGWTEAEKQHVADRVEALISGNSLAGVRAHSTCNIGCLSFGNVPFDADRKPFARTRLERALARLASATSPHPRVALHECRVAGQILGGSSHRAIEGYLTEAQAALLGELERATGTESYRNRAVNLFDQAARNFDHAGLAAIARRATQASHRLLQTCQYDLPGMLDGLPTKEGDGVPSSALLNPVMGFAIDIPDDLLGAKPPASALGVTRYRSVRRLRLADQDLCRLVNPLTSPSRRVVATVKPTRAGLAIDAGHVDAMRVLLGVSSARPSCVGVAGIDFESLTLDFDREWARPPSGRAVRVNAVPKVDGPHQVSVRCHMTSGETASLQFRIPDVVGAELIYA